MLDMKSLEALATPNSNGRVKIKSNKASTTRTPSPIKPSSKTKSNEELPIYIMELPSVEHKYKCPECSYDTFKRGNFAYHAKKSHSKVYEIFYLCIGCKQRFDQIRDCTNHVSTCKKIQKRVEIDSDADKRASRKRPLDSPDSPTINSEKPQTSPSSVTTNDQPNWEILFFTELGRSLVQNPNSASDLVKVVPILRNIVKEVSTKLLELERK